MIAIHCENGSFSDTWIRFCEEREVPYKIVDCFSPDIVDQLKECRALLWHWIHTDHAAGLFARQLIASVEEMGLVVFPNSATCWHYDDKIGQKFLLEAIGAPLVPTHIFFDRGAALRWVLTTSFPKVWKLRGGAGSENVRLVKSERQARSLIKRSFGRGWTFSRLSSLRERMWHFRRDRSLKSFLAIGRGLARIALPHETHLKQPIQRGYAYFQDFVPGNDFDIRVVTIGARCFAIKRHTRDGDFRASGSGRIGYDKSEIPLECITASFDMAKKLRAQAIAYDYVFEGRGLRLIEISYTFSPAGYLECPGYWDDMLEWHEGPVKPEEHIIEDLLGCIGKRDSHLA